MIVRNGTVWVGMIALMELTWTDNLYRLEAVYDLATPLPQTQTLIKEPLTAYRLLFVKGSFMKHDSKDNIGLKVLINELKIMKEK